MIQQPLQDHDDSSRWEALRRRMVERDLLGRGIDDQRVLDAMLQVPREEFVPPSLRGDAYGDWPLPIGFGQTISQPYTVAYMLQALQLGGGERVLEIGSGSGYGAAVLSLLAAEVHTVERIAELGWEVRSRLQRLGYDNVHVHIANGTLGVPAAAPFDGIVVTAGGSSLPKPLEEQLAEGGRAVIPIGDRGSQTLYRFTKRGSQLAGESLGGFAFVPLIGEYGWAED
jgi:protein-L-isoaspartate(D-aspartate) O-methyltransferase